MSFWKLNLVETNVRISILDLWGISFHAVVVFGIGKDLLFKSTVGPCVIPSEGQVN